jgi:endoglucanase
MITPQQMGIRGWMAVRALPYLDASAKDEMREAVKTYLAALDKQLDNTPFGVPPSLGTWGGSGAVIDMAIRMYFLHKTFPDLVGPGYTLRAVIPGYVIIKPDFPECIDDFGFLWFEDEAVVTGSVSWVVAGNAADAITKELK